MDAKDLAYIDYQNGMKYREIADKYGVSINTIKSWKKRNNWSRKAGAPPEKGCTQNEKGAHKNKGGQPGNQNAAGCGPPEGNVNAVKHGAYQSLYAKFLPEEEKELYEQMPGDADLEEEIRLLRLKLARLLTRDHDFFYDGFGVRHEKDISEEEREAGIQACMKQLEKLVRTQNQMQKNVLDEEEQRVRIEKMRAEVARITGNDEPETADDGFIDALRGKVAEVWQE